MSGERIIVGAHSPDRVNGAPGSAYLFEPTNLDSDNDGVDDPDDVCPGTVLPDQPTNGLKKNRYAATIDGFASTNGEIVHSLADTGGCSATQIIAEAGLGRGHSLFGISGSQLEDWIASL